MWSPDYYDEKWDWTMVMIFVPILQSKYFLTPIWVDWLTGGWAKGADNVSKAELITSWYGILVAQTDVIKTQTGDVLTKISFPRWQDSA